MNYINVQSEFLEYVDFSSVKQDNPETLRYSIDGKHFLLKYEGEQPEFVFNITQDLSLIHITEPTRPLYL